MMEFKLIRSAEVEGFEEIWKIYESGFPADERRDLESQKEFFKKENYHFYAVYEGSNLVGIITEWVFDDFTFGEHFAVKEDLRNKGYGSKVLDEFLSKKKLFIAEVDPPETEIAKRRIGFYERRGMKLNDYDYVQPPYSSDKSAVSMMLMSYPKKISVEEFEKIREGIHKKVYGFDKPVTKV